MKRILHRLAAPAQLGTVALVLAGCLEVGPGGVELKAGHGPVKAGSIEIGPGGLEVKGPSAGPIKARH